MRGIVTKSTGSWYSVRTDNGEIIQCRIKGKFRLKGFKHTNPITVGDIVDFELEDENGVIHKIHERKNYVIRKASNLSKQTHIIAANIDQAVLIVTLVFPKTSLGFIDRFLLTTEAYHIPTVIVFNKTDLEIEGLEEIINLYNKIGYTCLKTSAKNLNGLDVLRETLSGKISLVSGHSGVGKSSLLNALQPGLGIKTGDVSSYSQKGQHVTTFAEMHDLNFGGFVIDTPGIKEFGIYDISDADISHYFKEMKPLIGKCRFNDCRHLNEPDCVIIKAVKNDEISESRYKSYLSILLKDDYNL